MLSEIKSEDKDESAYSPHANVIGTKNIQEGEGKRCSTRNIYINHITAREGTCMDQETQVQLHVEFKAEIPLQSVV